MVKKMKPWEIVTEVMLEMKKQATVGAKLIDLNAIGEEIVLKNDGECYNKGYTHGGTKEPFPTAMCIGVNNIVAHGIPDEYVIEDGDLVHFDIGVKKDGLCGDAGYTVGVGNVEPKNERLMRIAKEALYQGIDTVKDGVTVGQISRAIMRYAYNQHYNVNKQFGGHVIGVEMHMPPHIPSVDPSSGEFDSTGEEVLHAGTMICLEPYLTVSKDIKGSIAIGDWVRINYDGKPVAFYEHQLLITKDGCEVLTKHFDRG